MVLVPVLRTGLLRSKEHRICLGIDDIAVPWTRARSRYPSRGTSHQGV